MVRAGLASLKRWRARHRTAPKTFGVEGFRLRQGFDLRYLLR